MLPELNYQIYTDNKPFALGLSPISRFDKPAIIALADSLFTSGCYQVVTVECFLTAMPNIPGITIYELHKKG